MRIRLAAFALCLFVSQLAVGQAAPTEITNSDVISMTKAGIVNRRSYLRFSMDRPNSNVAAGFNRAQRSRCVRPGA